MGPLINGLKSWLINGGDPNYLYTNWDDPPSVSQVIQSHFVLSGSRTEWGKETLR